MSENETLASAAELFPSKAKRRYRIEKLPVLGRKVRIQSLMEREQAEFETAIIAQGGGTNRLVKARLLDANRRLIALCLVDGEGQRLLTDNEARKIATWDAADSNFLTDVCKQHCGLNSDAIEELVKNSAETGDESPPTGSPPKLASRT